MQRSIPLGRIAGVPLGANWTWLIIFALVTWSLAAGVFPNHDPGMSDGAYWVMAAIAALLFFGSIVLHELGHALQARRDDVEIEGITLWRLVGLLAFDTVTTVPRSQWDARTVRDVMTPRDQVTVLDPDTHAGDAMHELAGIDTDRALVLDNDHLVGLVAPADLIRAIQTRGAEQPTGLAAERPTA